MAANSLPRLSIPAALGFCVVNWLVPGAGFLLLGNKIRGIVLFILINALFLIGLAQGGYIAGPESTASGFTFNLVAILTYSVQAFHGGGWIVLQMLHNAASGNPDATFNLVAMGQRAYSDLGVFHLIVAGGLNYLATVRLYDLTAGNPELTESVEVAVKNHDENDRDQE